MFQLRNDNSDIIVLNFQVYYLGNFRQYDLIQ